MRGSLGAGISRLPTRSGDSHPLRLRRRNAGESQNP